jgi:hypothetical protein
MHCVTTLNSKVREHRGEKDEKKMKEEEEQVVEGKKRMTEKKKKEYAERTRRRRNMGEETEKNTIQRGKRMKPADCIKTY